MTSPFTCITCRVIFRDMDTQRQHYKSDWHRYNLKRKITKLAPITAKEFQERAIVQYNKGDEQLKDYQNLYCKICRRKFNTKNQYDNHLASKKHKDNSIKNEVDDKDLSATREDINGDMLELNKSVFTKDNANDFCKIRDTKDEIEIDSDVESVSSDEWIEDTDNPMKNNDCLFCNHHSKSLTRNLKHMMVTHSFFIPDPEYCIDIKGLLIYLGEKIFAGYMCIWCNNSGKTFHSVDAVRAHMLDKGHCKMLHEGEALIEYTDFYDYSSSYPDDENSKDLDAEVEIPAKLDSNDYQLVLPSGNTIGHRSLMRYYKQNLKATTIVSVPKNEKSHKLLLQYRALGWTGTEREIIVKKARDIKYMQRVQAKYLTRLQFKANKLQYYFKKQVNF